MLQDTIKDNENVQVNSKEMEALKEHFPQCFDASGNFDMAIFEELVKTKDISIKKEGYALNFLGKSYARYLSNLESETVIVPDESNKDNPSENIYIVGDNLHALQHLKHSYAGAIKCIYIDPPYNTGSDGFVYNDKFEFSAKDLAEKIGIEEDEAERVLNMQGKSTHSAWLTFMYPRLELAKELLAEDGVIFISIDDNEQANCKLLCDAVFGEAGFVASFPWRKRTAKSDVPFGISQDYEWILTYAKSQKFSAAIEGGTRKYFETPDFPGRPWRIHDLTKQTSASERPKSFFTLVNPKTGKEYPANPNRTWAITKDTFEGYYKQGKIVFPDDYDFLKITQPAFRYFKDEDEKKAGEKFGCIAVSTNLPKEIGMTKDGTADIDELFDKKVFGFPKPVALLKFLISITTKFDKNAIILDFFSGSATTAHAIMQLSTEEDKKLKYILVQLDEPVKAESEAEKAGYKTIDEIGRERIRRAAAKIRADEPEKSKGVDLGFKTYYLKTPEKHTLDKIESFNPEFPVDGDDIIAAFGKDTVLATWAIKDGYGFNTPINEIDLKGHTAYFINDGIHGANLYILDEISESSIMELVRRLEANELVVDKIIVYGYALSFTASTSLRTNLKTLKNRNPIDVVIRY